MMEKDDAEDMRELLSYRSSSAGGIMTTDYASAHLDEARPRRSSACASRRPRPRPSTTSTSSTGPSTCAALSLRELLMTPPEKKVRDFMTETPVSVRTTQRGRDHQRDRQVQPARPAGGGRGRRLYSIITIDDAIDLVLPLAWKKRLPRIFH